MPTTPRLILDLDEVTEYPVRLALDHDGYRVVFEGLTRFTFRDLPRYRGDRGPRLSISPTVRPSWEWIAPDNYFTGADMLEDGMYFCYLLDRYREMDLGQARAQMEMALDTLCVQEGLDGVTFS